MSLDYDYILSNLLDNYVSKLVVISGKDDKFLDAEKVLKIISGCCSAIELVRNINQKVDIPIDRCTVLSDQLINDSNNLLEILNEHNKSIA